MIDHFPLPIQGIPERRHLYRWITEEERYVAEKYDDHQDYHDEMMRDNFDWWLDYLARYLNAATNYLAEAKVATIEKDRHRLEKLAQQQMAKFAMTAKGMVESSIRVFGSMPKPGVSSGEILRWFDIVYHKATHEE